MTNTTKKFGCPKCGSQNTVVDLPNASAEKSYDDDGKLIAEVVDTGEFSENERCESCGTLFDSDEWSHEEK